MILRRRFFDRIAEDILGIALPLSSEQDAGCLDIACILLTVSGLVREGCMSELHALAAAAAEMAEATIRRIDEG